MRILYLLYNQQDSLIEFSNNPKINLSWVDALFDELLKCESITLALAVPINNNSVQKIEKNGITVFGLPNPEEKSIFNKAYKRLTRATENIKLNSSITQVINDFEPDIIQIFGSESPFGLIVWQQKKPVIIHIQGYLFVWQGKWFSGISKWEQFIYASLKDLLLMRGCYQDYFTFRKKSEAEAIILKNCNYFMGRTNFDKRIISLVSPGSRYFHCEEFIRKEFFEKQWNFPRQNEIVCISIIKGTSYKGTDLLVKCSLILKKYSTLSFKFKICGASGNEEIIKIIKKKFKKEIGFKDIEFLGKLTADDLVKQLCNSNFYIHPSYIENSPNGICEAMALGMPIIATNVGGVSTLIEDEVEGILVQEGEPYSMAGAIVELTNNYEKAKQLGSNARVKASKRHEPNGIARSLLKIYENIIYQNGRKELS
jgi:glycosyltransferase involved in cell wall biosynthesis